MPQPARSPNPTGSSRPRYIQSWEAVGSVSRSSRKAAAARRVSLVRNRGSGVSAVAVTNGGTLLRCPMPDASWVAEPRLKQIIVEDEDGSHRYQYSNGWPSCTMHADRRPMMIATMPGARRSLLSPGKWWAPRGRGRGPPRHAPRRSRREDGGREPSRRGCVRARGPRPSARTLRPPPCGCVSRGSAGASAPALRESVPATVDRPCVRPFPVLGLLPLRAGSDHTCAGGLLPPRVPTALPRLA